MRNRYISKRYLNEAPLYHLNAEAVLKRYIPRTKKCKSVDRSSFYAMSDHLIQPTQNLSFVLERVKSLRFEDRPFPQLRDNHVVLVRVKCTGICGSDEAHLS